ncbi:hypothetical protein D9M70_482740 [compost metagenome]
MPVADAVIGVAHVETHDERRLVLAGHVLQEVSLAIVHLDRVRCRRNQSLHHGGHVFETVEEGRFVADAMIDRDIEATSATEKTVHPDLAVVSHNALLCSFRAERVSSSTPWRSARRVRKRLRS